MKKTVLFFLTCILFSFSSYAQNFIVKGKVIDESESGVPGAIVKLKNTTVGVVTDLDGNYTIKVNNPSTDILIFSFLGFETQEISINKRTQIDVRLKNAVSKLNEVVVTALGISREQKSLGYSQQSVNVEQMTEARDPNIANMLAGKVSGLQVSTSGQPTGSTRVILRGISSLTGNNQPLWVVDGVPIDNSQGQINDLDYGNGAADLNPDDIASIEVLKGPNAAALYGSRAANGAILITTKKGGDAGKALGISFNSNVMFNSVYQFQEYQNIYGEGNAMRLVQGTNRIDLGLGVFKQGTHARSWGSPMLGQPIATYSGELRSYVPQPDNITDLYQTSFRGTQNIAISKGDNTSSFRLSYTYSDGNDVIEEQNKQKKHNVSLNASKNLSQQIKIDTRIQYIKEDVQNRTLRNLNPNSPMSSNVYLVRSIAIDDLTPWKDANGASFSLPGFLGYENPYWNIYENFNQDNKSRFIGGVTATIGLTKFLKFRGQISSDLSNGKGFAFLEKGGIATPTGSYRNFTQENKIWNTEGLFMYDQKFKDFSVTANFGGNLRSSDSYRTTAAVSTLAEQNVMNLSNAAGFIENIELPIRSKVNSLYGSANFGYKGYLYLDLTARNDWSSTLPKSNWSFFYPSASLSYILSDAVKLPKVISLAKIRGSIAKVGNDADPYNLYSSFNYTGSFNGYSYVTFDNIYKNQNLKPEITTSTELGLDLDFFSKRLTLNGTVYQSSTVNQIFSSLVPSESGFNRSILNAGEIQNKGIELSMFVKVLKSKNFSWDLNANYSKNKNKVLSLAPGIDRFVIGGDGPLTVAAEVGEPIGVMRGNSGYKATTGELILQTSGNPYLQPLTYLGNFLPDWLGNVGSNFKYKNFDLNLNFGIKMGGDLYSLSNFRANTTGNTIASLEGREEWLFSDLVLGENANERNGTIQLYNLPYPDAGRNKGQFFDGYLPLRDVNGNIVYDANGRMMPGDKLLSYILPQTFWQSTLQNQEYNLFDASYIKLNQLIFGYNLPAKILKKTPFKSARFSLVGRNLWILYSNTPKGVDPESVSSSGNLQGLENGGSLPYSSYGFDFKLSF